MNQQLRIEKRVVNSLPEVFGEIGGLTELLKSAIVLVIGGFQAKAFFSDQMKSLYRINLPEA